LVVVAPICSFALPAIPAQPTCKLKLKDADVNIRLPLYDIFGYLLPGIVAMLAATLLIWSIYLPAIPLTFMTLPKQVWLILTVLAYFAGHFVQALGNALSDFFVRPEEHIFGEQADASCKELMKEVHAVVHKALGVNKVEPAWIYRICDATVLHCGTTSEREIYVYREGFYRGASVSFGLLAIGLFVRSLIGRTSLLWNGSLVTVPGSLLWVLVILTGCGCVLMVLRFHRFAQYRVKHALVSYLLIHKRLTETKNA
jgi:hypothetical protein